MSERTISPQGTQEPGFERMTQAAIEQTLALAPFYQAIPIGLGIMFATIGALSILWGLGFIGNTPDAQPFALVGLAFLIGGPLFMTFVFKQQQKFLNTIKEELAAMKAAQQKED